MAIQDGVVALEPEALVQTVEPEVEALQMAHLMVILEQCPAEVEAGGEFLLETVATQAVPAQQAVWL